MSQFSLEVKNIKKLNMKFSEEGLGIGHTFPIVIIILLLLFQAKNKAQKTQEELLTFPLSA